ncbi:MAG: hypothetical protein AAGI07_14280 [Bacteroidota bacterium]
MKQKSEIPFNPILLRWRSRQQLFAVGLFALFFMPILILSYYYLPNYLLFLALMWGVFSAIVAFLYYKKIAITEKQVAMFLDKHFPQVESSSFLFLKEKATLTILEKIQIKKVVNNYEQIFQEIKIPIPLTGVFLLAVLISSVTFFIGKYVTLTIEESNEITVNQIVNDTIDNTKLKINVKPQIQKINTRIYPPTYTKLPVSTVNIGNVTVPQHSKLLIKVQFTQTVNTCILKRLNGEQMVDTIPGNAFKFVLTANENDIYQIVYTNGKNTETGSDYYKIEIVPDRKPEIIISDLPQYQHFDFGKPAMVNLNAIVKDDYGLSDAYLIATISKGSGESVKFREEKIALKSALESNTKEAVIERSLDLYALGATPGDELYFYLEALDNRQPKPLKSRTETYFVLLKDSVQEVITIAGGMAVDLMPAYFRSQRQLIIDTEKLITQRDKIPKQTFNKTSNNIGYDQKVLRLRYGKFLGEEFESDLDGRNLEPQQGETDHEHHSHEHHNHEHDHTNESEKVKALVNQFAHLHDTQDEIEKNLLDNHNQDHENSTEDNTVTLNNGAVVDEALVHTHDSEEAATFYFSATKLQLKAALSLMWQSELHLRMNEPEKALPIEYEILTLLKQVQQKSRIYVERIGFEPPPIKVLEKRLKGELHEITSPRIIEENKDDVPLATVKETIAVLERIKINQNAPFAWEKEILAKAGNEIAAFAIEHPAKYLNLLQTIKHIQNTSLENRIEVDEITKLQSELLKILPQDFHAYFAKEKTKNRLMEIFNREVQSL